MSTSSSLGWLTQQSQLLDEPGQRTHLYFILSIIIILVTARFNLSKCYSKVPIINPGKRFSLSNFESKRAYVTRCNSLMTSARALYPKQPFRVITDLGELLVLPPDFADEIRNNPSLDLSRALFVDFHGDIRGFELLSLTGSNYHVVQSVSQKQLTRSLAAVTEPLSEEATYALSINLGDSEDWQEITLKPALEDIIARLSARVFVGNGNCRNEDWLRITKEYTVSMFIAASELQLYPRFSRKVVHWVLPQCRKLRAQFAEARRVMDSVLGERQSIKQAHRATGRPVPDFNDAIDWADDAAKSAGVTYDKAKLQLALSVASIHTTTDLLEQVVLDLAQHPEIFQPLREEISQCLRIHGWKKTSLYTMKLLDSVIRESQRMKPTSIVSMRRWVEKDLTLSTGFRLRKGTRLAVDCYRMWDPSLHAHPSQWDGYRFLNLRSQPGNEHIAQLVSTSADHLAFGHGLHACPGRFFAANEIKIALCHLLIKYDWVLASGTDFAPVMNGVSAIASPSARVLVRRRREKEREIDVDDI